MAWLGKLRTQSLGTKQPDSSICDFGVVFRGSIRFIYAHKGYGGEVPKTHLKITNRGRLWGGANNRGLKVNKFASGQFKWGGF